MTFKGLLTVALSGLKSVVVLLNSVEIYPEYFDSRIDIVHKLDHG